MLGGIFGVGGHRRFANVVGGMCVFVFSTPSNEKVARE